MTHATNQASLPTTMADRRANELLGSVIADAGLTHDQVADGSGYSREHVTRVLLGQYAVPPEIIAYVWRVTHDRRVITAVFGPEAADLTYLPELTRDLGDLAPHIALATAQVAMAELQHGIALGGKTVADAERRLTAAERAARHLFAFIRVGRAGAARLTPRAGDAA